YEEDATVDPKVVEYLHISEAFEHAGEFDLLHSHYDFMALTYTRLIRTPVLTTIHGFSSPKIMPIYHKYGDGYFVSVSDSDRATGLNYLATVYNGIDLSLYPLQDSGRHDLIFLGRIHPDKGVHLAIEVARLSGLRFIIAMDLGSCREVINDGETGFLVANVAEAVRVLERILEIDRRACRGRVQQHFSIDTMVEGYERVYSTIFDLEARSRS